MAAPTPEVLPSPNAVSDARALSGKVALVTGAASGIGRAIVQTLAQRGARIFGHDLDDEGLAATARLVGDGVAFTTRAGNLASRAECRDAVDAAVAAFGRLDVLGNVAGISRAEHFTDVSEEAYRRLMAVNVDAPFFLSQAAIPHLLETGGSIVNIASSAGLLGQAYMAAYCMSKGAIVQLTRALAMEYLKTSIRVNAIAPAGIITPMAAEFELPDNPDPDLLQRFMPPRPMVEPEQIAELFAFLVSPQASHIHGAVISVDGGVTAG